MPRTRAKTDTSRSQYLAKNVRPFRVAGDPKPAGPLCLCGCGRERPRAAVEHEDPFATTECAKRHYGVNFANRGSRGA